MFVAQTYALQSVTPIAPCTEQPVHALRRCALSTLCDSREVSCTAGLQHVTLVPSPGAV